MNNPMSLAGGNLSPSEQERYAYLSGDVVTAKLWGIAVGNESRGDRMVDAMWHIGETKGQLPDEDFLSGLQHELEALMKTARGGTKTRLGGIIALLDQLQDDLRSRVDQAMGELCEAEALLDKP